MTRAIESGVEFYLERRLFREGRPYAPWLRLHYPNHYFYDILVGLDLVTEFGFVDDPRLAPALRILRQKRQRDGSWRLERLHPDIGAGIPVNPPIQKLKPLPVEREGAPSKWLTLKALTVLRRTASS
jgi:hypothetical protein